MDRATDCPRGALEINLRPGLHVKGAHGFPQLLSVSFGSHRASSE